MASEKQMIYIFVFILSVVIVSLCYFSHAKAVASMISLFPHSPSHLSPCCSLVHRRIRLLYLEKASTNTSLVPSPFTKEPGYESTTNT